MYAVGRPNTGSQPAHNIAESSQPGGQSFRPTGHFPGQCVWRFEQQRQRAEF